MWQINEWSNAMVIMHSHHPPHIMNEDGECCEPAAIGLPLFRTDGYVIGFLQSLRKTRRRLKSPIAHRYLRRRTRVLRHCGVDRTRTAPRPALRWSCDVNLGIAMPAYPANPPCYAVKRRHGRLYRASPYSAVRMHIHTQFHVDLLICGLLNHAASSSGITSSIGLHGLLWG
jgi:hypothetical protein